MPRRSGNELLEMVLSTGALVGSLVSLLGALRFSAYAKHVHALDHAARLSASEAVCLSSDAPASELAAVSGIATSARGARAMEGQEVALLKDDRRLGVQTFTTLDCHDLRLAATKDGGHPSVAVDVKALRRVVEEPGNGLPVLYGLQQGGSSAVRAVRGSQLTPAGLLPQLSRAQSFLPLGAIATIVGRLVVHETGVVEITAHPRFGMFLLGRGASLTGTLASLRQLHYRWRTATITAGAISVACLFGLAAPDAVVGAWDMLRYWGSCAGAKVGLWEMPPTAPTIRWPGASRPGAGPTVGGDGGGVTECIACIERGANCALMPCGHVCLCIRCAGRLRFSAPSSGRRCPICRSGISEIQRVFIAGELLPEHQPRRRGRRRSGSGSSSDSGSGSGSGSGSDSDASADTDAAADADADAEAEGGDGAASAPDAPAADDGPQPQPQPHPQSQAPIAPHAGAAGAAHDNADNVGEGGEGVEW